MRRSSPYLVLFLACGFVAGWSQTGGTRRRRRHLRRQLRRRPRLRRRHRTPRPAAEPGSRPRAARSMPTATRSRPGPRARGDARLRDPSRPCRRQGRRHLDSRAAHDGVAGSAAGMEAEPSRRRGCPPPCFVCPERTSRAPSTRRLIFTITPAADDAGAVRGRGQEPRRRSASAPSPIWAAVRAISSTPSSRRASRYKGRVATFFTFSADGINEPGWSERYRGARGARLQGRRDRVKVSKGLGPGRENPDGTYIQADDPRLDAFWEMCGEVQNAGHDPHERFDRPLLPDQPEQRTLRSRSLARARRHLRQPLQTDSRRIDVIEKARENMHRKHPKTIFVNAHMAMLYYDPAKVAKLLDTYPNAELEVSATPPGSGPRAAALARVHHQVSGPRPLRHRRRRQQQPGHVLEPALPVLRDLRRVLRASSADPHGRRLARPRPLEHLRDFALPDAVLRKVYYQTR